MFTLISRKSNASASRGPLFVRDVLSSHASDSNHWRCCFLRAPRQLQSRRPEELPPFDKGRQGGRGAGGDLRPRPSRKIKSPLYPPFSKGEVGGSQARGASTFCSKRSEDHVGALALDLQFRRERHAMAQRRQGDGLDVVGRDEVAAVDQRLGAGGAHQRDAAARAGAGCDARPGARGARDAHRVVGHALDRR